MNKLTIKTFCFAILLSIILASGVGATFTQVATFSSYGPWGACVWNGRLYVGFYVGHTDLPIYRSGVNNDSFSFVRNLGSGESMPRLWVSPDGTTLNALTEGLSGSAQSPAVHWWTTDSANAQSWSSRTVGTGSQYRYGTAALVYGNDQYIGWNQPNSACLIQKKSGSGNWSQFGPLVTPSEGELIMEMQVFNDQFYALGSKANAYTTPNCSRVVRYNSSTGNWDQVFTHNDGLIASSAVFDGKLWAGTVFGTKIYSTADGTTWNQEYSFGLSGSWAVAEAMMVYKNKLYVVCDNGDNMLKVAVRPPGGTFTEIYSSNQYKGCGEFVVRGDDLYLFVERVAGGTAVLKYTEIDDTTPPSVPANVQANAESSSSIKISWTASTDNVVVAGYKLFRNGLQIGTTASISYIDNNLSANTTYSYTVSAYDIAGNNSAQSSPQAVATTLGFGKTGQEGITGGVGLNNIGLLARIWGKFTYVDSVTFLLDDGSGQPAKCTAPPGVTLDPAWDFVTATGIVSCRIEGQDVVGILKLRNQADIEVLQ